jgi:adenine-specific DNA-methyltransferase
LGRGDGGEGASGALTPKEISKLKFADIACGSGSFLIAVYDKVLHHIEKYYNDHPDEAKKAGCVEIDKGIYALSLKQKQQILIDNIFGVDIDHQAVEVAQLSLFLKLLESESAGTAGQLSFEKTKILPDLSKNILNGNSLVEYDIADLFPLSTEDEAKIKPFDFKTSFKDIMAKGGFDAIVGNPPYGAELETAVMKYLEKRFNLGNTDTAALFMQHANNLTKAQGYVGYIIPKSFTYASNWQKTRQSLIDDLIGIVDCSKVWKGVKLEMSIYISKRLSKNNLFLSSVRIGEEIIFMGDIPKELCDQFGFILNGISENELTVAKKIKSHTSNLNDFVTNQRGGMLQKYVKTGGDRLVLGGKEIGRYEFRPNTEKTLTHDDVQDTSGLIEPNSILVQNIVAHVMNPQPHIVIISSLAKDLSENSNSLILDTVNQLRNKSNYSSNFIIAIVNSSLVSWYVYRFIFANAIRTMHFDSPITSRIPFPILDFTNPSDKSKHDALVKLVDQMLDTKKRLAAASRDSERTQLERKCEYLDSEIDKVVYGLYGLTEEEIGIVEGKA